MASSKIGGEGGQGDQQKSKVLVGAILCICQTYQIMTDGKADWLMKDKRMM